MRSFLTPTLNTPHSSCGMVPHQGTLGGQQNQTRKMRLRETVSEKPRTAKRKAEVMLRAGRRSGPPSA